MARSSRLLPLILGIACSLGSRAARGHDEKASLSDVEVKGRLLVWKVDVGIAGLEKKIKMPAAGVDLTEQDVEKVKPEIAAYLVEGLVVTIDGHTARPEVGAMTPQYEPFIATGQPMITRVVLERCCDTCRTPDSSCTKRVRATSLTRAS